MVDFRSAIDPERTSTAWTCVRNCLLLDREHRGRIRNEAARIYRTDWLIGEWPAVAEAQQRPTLGLLSSSEMANWAIKAFRAGLEEGGFVEGRNLTVICRSAENQFDRLPALAEELVKSQVSVYFRDRITSPGVGGENGYVNDSGRLCLWWRSGQRRPCRELQPARRKRHRRDLYRDGADVKADGTLREMLPQVSDIALLVNPKGTLADVQIDEAKAAAQVFGLKLHIVNAISESEFDEAFATMSRLKVGAFLISTDPLFGFSGRVLHITMALRNGIPAICVGRADVVAGGLFSYGPDLSDTWRQAGVYIGRILKGEKPSELPVVQPTKFELVINLKTAKQLGIDISPSLLARADEVIE